MDQWGSVDGDHNADAIMRDRRAEQAMDKYGLIVLGVALTGSMIWHGFTGDPWALSWLVLSGVWAVNAQTSRDIFTTHTFVMIAERRTQLLEQKVAQMQEDLYEARRDLEKLRGRGDATFY